jgi:hypothetical protein
VREVYFLWFDVPWNSDLQLPFSNVNVGKLTSRRYVVFKRFYFLKFTTNFTKYELV